MGVRSSPKNIIGLMVVLMGVWLLWSGHYTPLLLTLGAVSCALVVFISYRMHIIDDEGQPTSLGLFRSLAYLAWLAVEVVKANIDVAKRVLSWDIDAAISPCRAWIEAPQRTPLGQVIYANSITLTPGTVSIELGEGKILVHALSAAGLADLQTGKMAEKASDLERPA